MRRWQVIIGVVLCTGCAASPPPAPSAAPISGLSPATQRGASYTFEQLIQIDIAMIGFAEWYVSRLSYACDTIAAHATTPEARQQALRLKANQAAAVYAIVAGPNPVVSVLNFAVLVNLTQQRWVGEGLAQQSFGNDAPLLIEALNEAMRRGHANALRVISEPELQAVEKIVVAWRKANPNMADIEFIRMEDFTMELARGLLPQQADDLMSRIESAAVGLDQTRLLGERALFLTTRFPRLMGWEMNAQMASLSAQPETKKLISDLGQLTQIITDFQKQTNALSASVQAQAESLPQKMMDLVNASPAIKQGFSTANEAMARTDLAIKQMAQLESAVTGLQSAVTSLASEVEQVNKAYEPALVQKMAADANVAALRSVRSLIFVASGCVAGLLILGALLRRFVPRRA